MKARNPTNVRAERPLKDITIPEHLPRVTALADEWELLGLLGTTEPAFRIGNEEADSMRWRVVSEDVVGLVRQQAAAALEVATFEIETLQTIKRESRRANELLAALREQLCAVEKIDPKTVAHDFEYITFNRSDIAGFPYLHARSTLDLILGQAGVLKNAIDSLYSAYPIKPAEKKRRSLPYFLIARLAPVYRQITERPVPKGRVGPFVRLLAATWEDLGWPVPEQQTDLTGWLGSLVEKHPTVTEKATKR